MKVASGTTRGASFTMLFDDLTVRRGTIMAEGMLQLEGHVCEVLNTKFLDRQELPLTEMRTSLH